MFSTGNKTNRFYIILMFCAVMFSGVAASQAQIDSAFFVRPPSWSPDGSRVAFVVGNDVEVEVHDASSTQLLYTLTGHTDTIPMVAWSPDSSMIATVSYDQTVKLWNATDGELLQTLSGHNEALTAIVWSPDGSQILSWGSDTGPDLFVWDAATGVLISSHDSPDVEDVVFSPDGQRLALSTALSVYILDAQTLELLARSPRVPCCPNTMFSIAWSPDGTKLVTGSISGLVTLWDANTAQILEQFVVNSYYQPDSRDVDNLELSWVRDVMFAPDGNTVLSVSGDGTVSEYDVNTGELVQQTNISPLAGATWSPYGTRLAITGLGWQNESDKQDFDASTIDGTLNVIVPFATINQAQIIAEACNATATTETALTDSIQADQLAEFVAELEALPENAIAPACAADLLAVVEALQAQERD